MKLRNLTRTFNYLSPQQKLVTAIAAVVGGGVLLCIPLLSLQPPRSSVSVGGGSSGAPIGASNPSGTDDTGLSQAPPLDTANPIDIPSDSSTGTGLGSDSSTSGSGNSLTGSSNNGTLDTTDPLDERVGNRRSPAPSNDTLSGNVDSPYSQSTSRYQSPNSISGGSYSASPGSGSLSTVYSRSAGGSAAMSRSSSQSANLQPAQGNNFTYLNPFSPNSGAGTTASPSGTSLPANSSAIPSQSAVAPSGLSGTGQNGMNPTPSSGSGGFTPPSATTSPGNTPNR